MDTTIRLPPVAPPPLWAGIRLPDKQFPGGGHPPAFWAGKHDGYANWRGVPGCNRVRRSEILPKSCAVMKSVFAHVRSRTVVQKRMGFGYDAG